MTPRSYSEEGVVLARRSYGEADRIISVYTKNRGRVSLMAKGIRKPSSRKRGHLEVFSHIKFQATSNRELGLITEAETVENFPEIRKSLPKSSLAYYFLEVVGKITHEGESYSDLFDFLLEYLNRIEKENQLKKIRLDFIAGILTLMGYWPKNKKLINHDEKLEEVIERSLSSLRVGKRVLN
jgi:DNA repair protein RecO (recombination protein O)